jgi:transposase
MEVLAPLALPEGLEITEIEMIDDVFTITAHCTREHPCCPLCGIPAQRFHSSYLRRITDLPSGGKRVCLRVLVRKCFCDVSTCVRKIKLLEAERAEWMAWKEAQIRGHDDLACQCNPGEKVRRTI